MYALPIRNVVIPPVVALGGSQVFSMSALPTVAV